MIETTLTTPTRINQGDICKNIEYIEYMNLDSTLEIVEISKIDFPSVFVLSQDCDLSQDFKFRTKCKSRTEINPLDTSINQDKFLLSVLVAPLYVAEQVFIGEHLIELGNHMGIQGKRDKEIIMQNQRERYHYLDFDSCVHLPASIIDFKHYFSVNVQNLQSDIDKKFVCSVSPLYREHVCQRFSNYLSRIGLPDPKYME